MMKNPYDERKSEDIDTLKARLAKLENEKRI